jgi:hypothetical protein
VALQWHGSGYKIHVLGFLISVFGSVLGVVSPVKRNKLGHASVGVGQMPFNALVETPTETFD